MGATTSARRKGFDDKTNKSKNKRKTRLKPREFAYSIVSGRFLGDSPPPHHRLSRCVGTKPTRQGIVPRSFAGLDDHCSCHMGIPNKISKTPNLQQFGEVGPQLHCGKATQCLRHATVYTGNYLDCLKRIVIGVDACFLETTSKQYC